MGRRANRCLRDLRRQKDLVESLEPPVEPAFPSAAPRWSCQRYAGADEIIIERGEPDGRFSGWHITCGDDTDRHELADLKLTSLFEVALKAPGLVPFLALPPGCCRRHHRDRRGVVPSAGCALSGDAGVVSRHASIGDSSRRSCKPEGGIASASSSRPTGSMIPGRR